MSRGTPGFASPSVPAILFLFYHLLAAPAFAGFAGTDVFLPSVGARPGVPPAVWYTT
ncbi:MAG: hypothetical protein HRF46_01835, partial [Acidobacteriota bacterium]